MWSPLRGLGRPLPVSIDCGHLLQGEPVLLHDLIHGVAARQTPEDREDRDSVSDEGHPSGVEARVDRGTRDTDLERDGIVVGLEYQRPEVSFEDLNEGMLASLHPVER